MDTAPDIINAAVEFLGLKGVEAPPPERIRAHIGHGLNQLLYGIWPNREELLSSPHREKLENDFYEIYNRHYLTAPRAFAGIEDFLHSWEGAIAIVSNKRERYVREIMSAIQLDRFPWSAIIGGDTLARKKPDPMGLVYAMNAAKADSQNTIMIGDGEPDVLAAKALGIPCFVVEFGYEDPEALMRLGATRTLAHFRELPDALG